LGSPIQKEAILPQVTIPTAYDGVFSYEEGTGFVNKLVWPLYENQEEHYSEFRMPEVSI
jgi:hypothetical protein